MGFAVPPAAAAAAATLLGFFCFLSLCLGTLCVCCSAGFLLGTFCFVLWMFCAFGYFLSVYGCSVIIGCRNPFFLRLLLCFLCLYSLFFCLSSSPGYLGRQVKFCFFFLTADLYARAYRFFLDLLECLLFPLLDWRTVFCFFHWRSSSCLFSVPARLLRSALLPVTPSALFTSSCYTCCSNYLFIWRWCEHLSFMFLL